jgi:hypothetical protein
VCFYLLSVKWRDLCARYLQKKGNRQGLVFAAFPFGGA